MKDEKTWVDNDEWDDDDDGPTENEVWNMMRLWAEVKINGGHYNIITPYYSIINGEFKPAPPRDLYILKPGDVKPLTNKERMRLRKKRLAAIRKCFEGFYKEDYIEEWRKRGRRKL